MKTLEQIQEENRKVIIMANNPEAKDKPLTLDRVLIALGVGFETKTFQDRSPDKDMYLYIFNKSDRGVFWMLWDLSKKTLERQGEETQRAINKLLIK
tara:strand:- start:1191 stop:1481 length:291 start_codon:yes stop_codon:yes gene_type:complete